MAYGNETFVAVGEDGSISSSKDRKTWTTHRIEYGAYLYGVEFADGIFVVVGIHGRMYMSSDGINWTDISATITKNSLVSVAYGNNRFLAVGKVDRDYGRQGPDHYAQLYFSPDGLTWTINVLPVKQSLHGTVYGKNSCIIVGTSGTILQSDNVAISMPWIPYLLLGE